MNIVGENFPEEIVKQIGVRQSKKGAKNRNPGGDPSLLVWQNANTGWVKVISSVNVNIDERKRVSNEEMAKSLLPDNNLAYNYVLFGGVYAQGLGREGLRSGISRNDIIHSDTAYGIGGTAYGILPMPGITSFSIKTETRGSLKTATIGIKAFNRYQFDIINTLYLSLGYSILIEWGNTMYYDNDSKLQKENPFSLADEFLGGKLEWDDILPKIQENRIKSCGNYDASLGKVVNFSWTLNRDLSYDITLTVRTIGDVIESLKMNALSGYVPTPGLVQEAFNKAGVQSGIDLFNKSKLVKQIYDYLTANRNLSDNQARGILANIARESSFNIAAYGIDSNNLPSGGLLQWNGPRFENMTKNVPDWKTNWKRQLDFAFTESQTKKYALEKFTDAEQATDWWVKYWEIPENIPQEQANRKELLKLFPPGLNYTTPPSPPVITHPLNTNEFYNVITGGAFSNVPNPPSSPTTPQSLNTSTPTTTSQPNNTQSVNIISNCAYTSDIGAMFYRLMQKLQATDVLTEGNDVIATKISFNNGSNTDRYYVRLGYFLKEVEKNIIYQLKNKDKSSPSKIIKFDYDIESNIILLYDRQISANPNVCIFQKDFPLSNNTSITIFPKLNKFLVDGFGSDYSSYGKLMNVYFDMTYILNQLQALKGDDGDTVLIDLMKSLTKGFCNSTGNFNKLSPTVDDEDNRIVFIDDVSLPDRDAFLSKLKPKKSNITADFKMYGYYAEGNKSLAGIVRNLSLTTTINPNLAKMITIGAQANGYVTGQDSTALSTMNLGLTDRVKKEWVEPLNPNPYPNPKTPPPLLLRRPTEPQPFNFNNAIPGQPDSPTPVPLFNDKYKDVVALFNRFIQEMESNTWNQDDIDAFSNSISSFAEYNQAEKTLKERQTNPTAASPNIGFLPFDLTLEIDGLSGMKVYQRFITDIEFLPSNYPQSLEFLIKGIKNEIKDNQWVTTIESLAIPKNPFGKKEDFNVGAPITGQASPTQRASGAAGTPRSSGFSTGRGGTTRVIDGKTYKNGEMEGVLRPINNQAKYKGAITSDGGRIRLYTKASLALDQLIAVAEQAGIPVKINAAYRTYQDQVQVRRLYPKDSDDPGTSNHGFGLAVDFATLGLKRIAPGDKLYDWLAAGNGAKYGFKRIASESWHWEYQNV